VNNAQQRLVELEGRVEEQAVRVDDVRDAVTRLEQRLETFEQRVDRRFDRFEERVDQRFLGVDGRLDSMQKLLWSLVVSVVGGALAILAGIVTALVQR
jgi:uncharacterized coiled-coil protein SlyX